MKHPQVIRINVVIDCAVGAADTLAQFYAKLLGWGDIQPATDGWAAVTATDGTVYAFQEVEEYTPPVWPWEAGRQGQMLHLDFWVRAHTHGLQYRSKVL